jgi:hypothetical protein
MPRIDPESRFQEKAFLGGEAGWDETVNRLKSQDFIVAPQKLWTGLWSRFGDLGRMPVDSTVLRALTHPVYGQLASTACR